MSNETKAASAAATNNTKTGATSKVRFITVTAMLSAISFVLMYFEFPIPIMPAFIKFDFSDLPALIGTFAYGPLCGVIVCLIKNLLHLMDSNSMLVGELSNFILGAAFVIPAGLIYKYKKNKKSAITGALIGALCMALFSFPSNYFVVYPIYSKMMPMDVIIGAYQAIVPSVKEFWQCLLFFNVPFTFVKGLFSVLITVVVYKKISPILKGRV